eukprot:TRINITY_DN2921_c0_g2_i1.p1 TRINITY_DN2921_c0_g2~~TRINITY_DN2921_c0_g2_i1.p1  ORF type:complete len:114 (-),score=15.39 TRINITY_DN2921_c0_g2_i1:367-708(-)
MWGMTSSGVLLLPAWLDYYHATKVKVCTSHCGWVLLSKLVVVTGTICSISVAGVALNPWSERLYLHLFFANGVFIGGAVFIAIDCLLSYRRGDPFVALLMVACFAVILFERSR